MTEATTYKIERAYDENGPDGWDLFENGEWANRFRLLREAKAAQAELLSATPDE